MKRTCLALLLTIATGGCDRGPGKSEASTAKAEPVATTAAKGDQKFGAGVTLTDATSLDVLLANPKDFAGKEVRVEGTVSDVCTKRGCWFELAGDKPGQKLRFKVDDGEMTFPVDSKGKHAIAQGKVRVSDLTLEESKQYAEHQAKEYGTPYDPATIKPMQIVRLDGTGAILRDKI